MIKVEGQPDLVRDPNSGAIINTNKSNVAIIKEARKKSEERLQTLENDVSEIKDMLKKLLNKKK
jgi:hypothetical protein